MNSQQFDDIIKNKAQQHESAVPADIWEGISNKKKKRRFPFFWLILLALLLGGGAIIWNMNNKKANINTAMTYKTKDKLVDKNTASEEMKAKTQTPTILDNTQKETVIDHPNKTNVSINDQHSTNPENIQQATNLNKQGETGHSRELAKKTNSFVNTTSSISTEELFAGKNNKRNTRNKTRIRITAGEIDNTANTNSEEIVAIKKQKINTDEEKKISIAAAQSDEPLSTISGNDLTENKKTTSAETATPDSLITKKISIPIADSSINDKKQLTALKPKKKIGAKKTSLKIEAGFTAVSAMQEYDRPLYVKRTINPSAIHSEFISNKLKTTIEPGAGLTISLVKAINKKWSAGVGVNYLRLTERLYFSGLQTNTNFTIVKRLVTDPNGSYLRPDTISVVTKDTTTINGRNIYNSFSIPVFVRYNLIKRNKWACSFTTGFYLGLLTKYHNSLPGKFETVYASRTNSSDSKNAIAIDIFAGLHFSGILWKKMEWFAEPGFRYNISKYGVNNLSFNKKIHSAGITFGISIPLKK